MKSAEEDGAKIKIGILIIILAAKYFDVISDVLDLMNF